MTKNLITIVALRGNGLSAAYAEMAADKDHEVEADGWCEALVGDGFDAAG